MYWNPLRLILVLATALTLQGCWIEIKVPEGGHVTGGSPALFCDAGQTCSIEVDDYEFSAYFNAVPWEGWIFMGWQQGSNHLCGGSTEGCHVFTDNPYLFGPSPEITEILESDEVFFLRPVFAPGTPIETAVAAITEPALRACIELAVSEHPDLIYAEDLARLECGDLRALQGLEAFIGLESLELEDFENESIDLSPLRALTRLRFLAIVGNGDDDTFEDTSHLAEQLIALTNLETLNLGRNEIHNLAPLTAALTQMKRLTRLDLSQNLIGNIGPLKNLTRLQHLNLWANQIENIGPLRAMTRLNTLDLAGNSITSIGPLAGLTDLESLSIAGSPLDGIGALRKMRWLRSLNLSSTGISDISPLAGLHRLEFLELRHNEITHLDALAELKRLYVLELRGNAIMDIGGLAALNRVIALNLRENRISDIGPLAGMTGLEVVDLRENDISDTSTLANMYRLVDLLLADNDISEISNLTRLTELSFLDLSQNQLSDIDNLLISIPLNADVAVRDNPLSCADIATLLALEEPSFLYAPLPDKCR